MEEVLIKLAGQIPSLLVLVFLTIKFLSHLKSITENYTRSIERIQNKNEETFEAMSVECHAIQEKSISSLHNVDKTLVANNLLIEKNVEIHKEVLQVLKQK